MTSSKTSISPPAFKTPQEFVHIKHKITLLQYKYWVLMLRTYRHMYEHDQLMFQEDDMIYMSMAKLSEHLGYQPKTSEIEHDLEELRKESIVYNVLEKDGENGKIGRGFITEWYVSSKRIGVVLPPIIRQALENLDDHKSIFYLLNWSVFNSFSGKYEAIIYKLCKDYAGATRTPYFELAQFREYMGIKDTEYVDFKRLNQWVISGPVKRINASELSEITVEANFKHAGRRVIGLWFSILPKNQSVLDFGDDVAFRLARVTIPIPLQRKYLESANSEYISLSIQRANEYADKAKEQGRPINNLGALYRRAIEENWGKEVLEKKVIDENVALAYEKKREAETASRAIEQSQEDFERSARAAVSVAIKEITADELTTYAAAFAQEQNLDLANTWNNEKGAFIKPADKAKFTGWLRTKIRVRLISEGKISDGNKERTSASH